MKTQKELKAQYKEILEKEVWRNSPSMVDYCLKKAAFIVELTNNNILIIDKPSIEKRFCFGYGLNGVSDYEEHKRAYDMCNIAANDQEYFINKNLAQIDEIVDDIKDTKNGSFKMYLMTQYMNCPDYCHLKGFRFLRWHESPRDGYEEVSPLDKERILQGYEVVRANFVKRLNTYLKKYGLSKIETWTYLRD